MPYATTEATQQIEVTGEIPPLPPWWIILAVAGVLIIGGIIIYKVS